MKDEGLWDEHGAMVRGVSATISASADVDGGEAELAGVLTHTITVNPHSHSNVRARVSWISDMDGLLVLQNARAIALA